MFFFSGKGFCLFGWGAFGFFHLFTSFQRCQNSLSLLNFIWDFSFGSQVPFEVDFFHLMGIAWCYVLFFSLFASVQQTHMSTSQVY